MSTRPGPHPEHRPGASTATTARGRWAERRAPWIDGVVAVLLFLYDAMYLAVQLVEVGGGSVPLLAVALVLSASLCVLFTLRRRWPAAVPLATLGLAWGYVLLGVGLSPAPLVLQYAILFFLGARHGRRTTLLAAGVVGAWIVVAALPLLELGYVRIGTVGLLVLAGFFVATLGLFAQARRHHLERLEALNRQLARERDAQAAVAAAEERARIAREMHDVVSHSLGTMVVMADGAARTASADPERAGEAMARVRDTGREALTEMRRMLGVLREGSNAPRGPQPGLERLDHLLDGVRGGGLRIDLDVVGAPVGLPAGPDLAAYRIVQEALTNARRHGGPLLSLVTVRLEYTADHLDLRILDDGGGQVTPPRLDGHSGHGLVGMRERVSAYGGTLEAGPRPGGGFAVHAVLPIGGEG